MLLPVCLLAGACNLLPDAYTGCDKPSLTSPHRNLPPLRAPDGAVAPDTRNAMHIPAASAPQIPAATGRCLDHPPSYGTKPAAG